MKIIRQSRQVGTVQAGEGFAEYVGSPIIRQRFWNGEKFVALEDGQGSDNRLSMWRNAPARPTVVKAISASHPDDRIELVDSLTDEVVATYQQGTL